jgi:predicted membrane GTPase involved in stress response
MEKVGPRRAELLDMRNPGVGTVRMRFKIPARGLLGYRSEFLTDTRGTGTMHHRFFEYGPWAGPLSGRSRGVLVADREGAVVAYALFNLQERGTMFVKPGDPAYEGMIVGENARTGDIDVNPSKEKKLTNMRTTASDEMIILEPPRQVTLELALEYIEDDELIEVTLLSRETSDWSLKRRSDSLDDEEFGDFEEDKDLDEDFDDELDEDELDEEELDDLDEYDDLDDEFDDEEDEEFRPRKGPRRDWE